MVAWTLRVYHLGTQSLWVDEGFSYDVARQGIRAIFAILPAEDRHPPLHYLLLWATMRVAGTSEFSLRFLSAGSAILAIPLTLTLGRRLGGRTVGFTAAALLAISPFHVWYSQEARMYALLATLSLASFYCWLRVVAGDRRWAWGYVLATMAALYTHYYAVFILPGEVVAALLLGKWHQHARRWLILVAISPIAFAPWLLDVWQQYQRAPHGYQPDQGLPATLAKIATTYVTGEYTALDPRLLALVAVLALLGVLPLTRPRELTGVTLAAWLLAAPLGAFLFSALAAVDIRATGQMYYIAGLPPFALLVARGAVWLGQRFHVRFGRATWLPSATAGLLVVAGAVAADKPALQRQYVDIVKEDFRSAAQMIESRLWPSDTIILDAQYIYRPFTYYYHGAAPWNRASVEPDKFAGALAQQTAGHDRVWLVLSHDALSDPQERVEGWLNQHGTVLDEAWLTGSHILLYGMEARPRFDRPNVGQPIDIRFADRAEIVAVDAPPTAIGGTTAHLTLIWHALAPFAEDDHIALFLSDAKGQIVWQTDHAPISQFYRPQQWKVGEYLTDRYDVVLPIGLPPGPYRFQIKMYSPTSGVIVSTNQGDVATLAPVTMNRSIATSPLPGSDVAAGLRLLKGSSNGPRVRPGDAVTANLVWQESAPPSFSGPILLQLLDGQRNAVAERDLKPIGGADPIEGWPIGSVVRDAEPLKIPARVAAGQYRLVVRGGSTVDVGPVQVEAIDRTFAVPSVRHPQSAVLAPADAPTSPVSELFGYDLDSPNLARGATTTLRLYWRAAGESAVDYVEFVHLVGPDSKIHGQVDRPPGNGARPTSGWLRGEIIRDDDAIALDGNAPPGQYYLELGMYRPDTGERLVAGDKNAITLGTTLVLR